MEQQKKDEKNQIERERRATIQARAYEKRIIREQKENERRALADKAAAEKEAEKQRFNSPPPISTSFSWKNSAGWRLHVAPVTVPAQLSG